MATKKAGAGDSFPYELLSNKNNRILGIIFIVSSFLVGGGYLIYLNKDKIKGKLALLKQKK